MEPNIKITGKMIERAMEIEGLLSEFKHSVKRDLVMRKENRLKSIHASLKIENNSLSLNQMRDVINGSPVVGNLREIIEVKNIYAAYDYSNRYRSSELEDFLLGHKKMMQWLERQAGMFRMGDVGVYDSFGNLIHLGARPQFVYQLMHDLYEWIKESELPLLIKSCIAHYEIEIIHPFEDGNGRMGRLWQNVMLTEYNSLFQDVPMETCVHKYQSEYYRVLEECNRDNDATRFVEFMLDVLHETLTGIIRDNGNLDGFEVMEKPEAPHIMTRNLRMRHTFSSLKISRSENKYQRTII